MLRKNGFRVEDAQEAEERLGHTALEHISRYHQYAEGALHGYSADEAATTLQRAIAPALWEHGRCDEQGRYASRNWLPIAARPV